MKKLLCLGLLLLPLTAMPHALKLSTCIITYNAEAQTLDVVMYCFQDDLGEHLAGLTGQAISFAPHTEATNQALTRYVQQNFSLTLNGKALALGQPTLYTEKENVEGIQFTIALPSGLPSAPRMAVHNSMMCDAFDKQNNMVRIDLAGRGNFTTLRCTKKSPVQEATL